MPRSIRQFNPRLPLCTVGARVQANVFADFDGFNTLLHNPSVRSKAQKENETVQAECYFAAKQHICENSSQSVGKQCKSNHDVQHGDSADTYTENCVSTVYEKIVRKKVVKCLILLEAGTGVEPVYTDLQ